MRKLILLASAAFLFNVAPAHADFNQGATDTIKEDTKLMKDDSLIKTDRVMRDQSKVGPTDEVLPQPTVVVDGSDSQVVAAVKDAFVKDDALKAYVVDVTADKGVVTLSGSVDSVKAKADLEAKARSVTGVVKVVNNITVVEKKI